jgi:hypothetical protein
VGWPWWVAVPALLLLAPPFVIGPLLLHRGLWKARRPRVEPVPPDGIPGDVAPYLTARAERVRGLGFELVGYAAVLGLTADVSSYLALLVNRAAGDRAMAACTGSRLKHAQYVEFCTELAGGVEVTTNDSPEVGVAAPDPQKRVFAFPGVEDVARLYRLHRRLLREAGPAPASLPPAPGDWPEELGRDFERDNARDARSGYWYLDAGDGKYRPTWKGAVLMAWKLAWPMGALRRALRRRRAAALLRRLEAEAS